MNLRILLPFRVFAETTAVTRIVAETSAGAFGLLPHRLDCVLALSPGILVYETKTGGEIFLAVDDGVLIKSGSNVHVSVRRAFEGMDLEHLRTSVEEQFAALTQREKDVRLVMAKLEAGFMHRLGGFQHE